MELLFFIGRYFKLYVYYLLVMRWNIFKIIILVFKNVVVNRKC